MSDSVKKWHETVSEDINTVYETAEVRREKKINKLLNLAKESGRMTEIMLRVVEVQKEFNTRSFLLGLEIACDELVKDEV
jgi:hypothetical protein|tara:strand:- start:1198 stop:1437 length:240 start_codon:yes stop_codon:yes gene_type:complete